MVSSSINNVLGSRPTLLLGSIGYALYIASYLYVTNALTVACRLIVLQPGNSVVNVHPGAGGFVIAAGAILGICAGMLWTAQGSLMLAYPTEQEKGKFIGIFWTVFNLGSVVGASVSLGRSWHSTVWFNISSQTCLKVCHYSHHYYWGNIQANQGEKIIVTTTRHHLSN